ncbi:ATP-binding protein [Sediminicoccus sp. BL-A-41-H5]|uniref:ATP-binding protein n=1 Tax=Sediminicoccus sp. BL-A-41-H5 TaxID=3421106 RepID=UPI003D676354
MTEARAEGRRLRGGAYAVLLGVLMMLGVGGFLLVRSEAMRLQHTAEAENLRLVAVGAQAATHGLRQTLEAVSSMQSLAASLALSYAEPGAPERRVIEGLLRDVATQGRFGILQVALIDRDGYLAWSTAAGFVGVDLADREHFRVHLDGWQGAFVSVPLIGRASGRWSLNITSGIRDADGGFVGVAVVSVDPMLLSASMGELQFAAGVTVNLLRRDGIVLARSQQTAEMLGVLRAGPDLPRIQEEPVGQKITQGPISGRAIFLAWRQIAGWPLAVTFAIDSASAMQDSARHAQDLYVLLVVALAAVAIGGLLLIELRARRAARETMAAVEASRAEISRLLNGLPGAAYRSLLSPEGELRRLHLSPAIARITGWPLERFAPAGSYNAIIEPEFRHGLHGFFLAVRQAGHGTMEYRLYGAAGPIWVRDDCRVISALPDGCVEVVGLITDITAERQLKAQALSAARLATLGEMAAGVAHELNQPCAAITLAADLAALELAQGGEERTTSAARRLDEIARQTLRMRSVIDHFRLFARVDQGGETAVDWAQALAGALTIAGGTMAASEVRVETALPSLLPPVRGSLIALEQVLVNLLVNARDAMEEIPAEERRVRISAEVTEDGAFVVLRVRDNGMGLAREAQERGFEPFFTTKPVGKGTGLGLSIIHGTVTGFGGTVTLGNHPEGGAEAEIRLPVAVVAAPAPA